MGTITEKSAKLDTYFESLLESHRIPGCALRVRKDGEIIYDKCFGVTGPDTNTAVTEDSVFYQASMTKPVTAVAVMQLTEAGKLSLDDDLLRFFPGFPEEKRAVTVRHLLNHCSGLGHGEKSNRYFEEHAKPGDSLLERISRMGEMPFDFLPGQGSSYSPVVGFEIIGCIVEIVSGMPFGKYVKENILLPLGMRDSGFVLNKEQRARLVPVCHSENGVLKYAYEDGEDPDMALIGGTDTYSSGCGGLFSTLKDYDRFTTMLAKGGELDGVRILSEDSLTRMHTPRQIHDLPAYPDFPGLHWGLGVLVFDEPEKCGIHTAPGTYGWSGAFGTHMFVEHKTGLSATYMVSMDDLGGGASPISREIERIVFEG